MDFTFRAICHREKICSSGSQSSNYTYLPQQEIQYYFERYKYNGGGYGHFRGNRDMVMMERELEKERLRGDILEEEAARRRELEAEVRRELREERELREVRWRGSVQWESYQRATFVEPRSFEKRIALPLQEGRYDFPRLEQRKVGGYEEELPFQQAPQQKVGGYEKELPFQQAPQAGVKSEGKKRLDIYSSNYSDVLKAEEEKKQIIFLAKPEANHSGKKRKDMASPLEGPSEVANKLTKEWNCALCQISATSKMGLEDHLKGKKHKSKLGGQKVGMIGLGLEKINNPLDNGQSNVELEKSQQTSSRNETDVKNNMGVVKKIKYGGEVQMMPKKKKMKFNFYCKLCKVGAFHEEVMNDHKKGKKHLLRLHRHGA